jgi:O-antigen/teichoic acid export membrane protein
VRAELLKAGQFLMIGAIFMVTVFWLLGDKVIALFFGQKYFMAQMYIAPLSCAAALFILTLPPMTAHFVAKNPKKLLQIIISNFILSAALISFCLYNHWPEIVPWAMTFVQFVLLVQAWRPFSIK